MSLSGPKFLEDLKSCVGLVLEGFLIPQIMLNLFLNSRENGRSCSFCLGNTFFGLSPHGYDLDGLMTMLFKFKWSYFMPIKVQIFTPMLGIL